MENWLTIHRKNKHGIDIFCKLDLRFESAFLVLFHTTMMLLTKALLEQFSKIGDQSEVEDPLVICKFFHPCHHRTRYATEYDPQNRIFFGFVD